MKWVSVIVLCIGLPFTSFAQSHIPAESLKSATDKLKDSKLGGESDRPIVYTIPSMLQVRVATQIYNEDLEVDIYYPPNHDFNGLLPIVLIVNGRSDKVYESGNLKKHSGGNAFRNMLWMITWAQAIAASGMGAILYETGPRPDINIGDVLAYLRQYQAYLGIDVHHAGILGYSGDGILAQDLVVNSKYNFKENTRCLVLYYAGDSEMVPMPQKGFPIFLVRPGKDYIPGNQTAYKKYIVAAHEAGVELTLVDYPEGEHAFDRINNTDRSREIIAETLEYLRSHLMKN